jgi:MYXO-CTERM domain-containing protein
MQKRFVGLTIVVSAFAAVAASQAAHAATYQIGPGKLAGFAQLPALQPGDVVEVDGNASYGSVTLKTNGTAEQKITIRGIRVDGKRPVLNGGVNTLDIASSHVVIEGFDITGGSSRCVFHRANDVTIRDTVIHDCPAHGVLGADYGSGSLLMEYDEVHHCGAGDQKHQIYMATDETTYPGSVFRLQHSYIHDGNGGHGVKSRAERNEIYYNWIEGSYYHELELIGPDGTAEQLKREDSDVVGNVIRKTGAVKGAHTTRLGGDGTGQTYGRYRFVNNTFILAANAGSVFRIFDHVDSLEASNNVIYREGGTPFEVLRTNEAAQPLPVVAGTNNWIAASATKVPAEWTGTKQGTDPAFVAMAAKDMHPAAASPLIDGGAASLPGAPGHEFPSGLAVPAFEPPPGVALAAGTAVARANSGTIDIGAYELGGATPVPPPVVTPPAPPPPTTPPTTDPTPPPTTEPPPAPPPPPTTTPPTTPPTTDPTPPTPPPTTTPPTTPPTTDPTPPTPPPTTTPPTTPPTTDPTPPTTTPPTTTPPTTPPSGDPAPVTPPSTTPPTTGGGSTTGMAPPAPPSGDVPPGGAPALTTDPTAPGSSGGHTTATSGGGCSVGSGSGSNALWLLGLGVAAVFRGRRRRRADS